MIFKNKQNLLLALIVTTFFSIANAQQFHVFRKKQMFLGLTGGVNYTLPTVKEHHNVLIPLDLSSSGEEKEYEKLFQNNSTQFGLYFSYSIDRNFSIVFQPSYYTYKFKYLTNYTWIDTVDIMNFTQEMKHVQSISTFSLPLSVRWDFTTNQISPYIQAGVFTDFRHRAYKSVYHDFTIDGEVDEKKASGTTNNTLVNPNFNKFNFGVTAGLGVSYYAKYFVIGIEGNYRYGFSNIVNDRNRYSDISGFTAQYLDVLDQMKLGNLNFQVTLLFPIDNSLSLNVLRRSKY